MGSSCSKCGVVLEPSPFDAPLPRGSDRSSNSRERNGGGWNAATAVHYTVDPAMHDLMKRSYAQAQLQQQQQQQQKVQAVSDANATTTAMDNVMPGQGHLLFKQQQKMSARLYHSSHATGGNGSGGLAPHYYKGGSLNARESPPKRSNKKQQQQQHEKTNTSAGPLHDLYDAAELDDLLYPKDLHGKTHLGSSSGNSTSHVHHNSNNISSSSNQSSSSSWTQYTTSCPTKLVVRRHSVRSSEEGLSGTHIYALRWPADRPLALQSQQQQPNFPQQEQHPSSSASSSSLRSHYHQRISAPLSLPTPARGKKMPDDAAAVAASLNTPTTTTDGDGAAAAAAGSVDHLFKPSAMSVPPKQKVVDWVTVSDEHCIYVADVGLSAADCDRMVQVTEQVCRGQYAAYTYAKQTLGCREFPVLAVAVQDAVHTITHAIVEFSKKNQTSASKVKLALDDREPHMVKYDVTKKERQKLDMHTDKSEWTFLVALSNGCGMDYEGGGTYFECLDATLHLQRGHALVFPGKLRHCGQRITAGLRFLLVGFLVDKTSTTSLTTTATGAGSGNSNATGTANGSSGTGVKAEVVTLSSSTAGPSTGTTTNPERDNDGFPTAIDLTNAP